MATPFTIGITGGSGSGKTYFINRLSAQFSDDQICLLSQDHYYKPRDLQVIDERGVKNFDLPEAIERERFPGLAEEVPSARSCADESCWSLEDYLRRRTNISQWVPSVDAVAEFKLQIGTLPAEYGRSGGSFMNTVIRSGTNDLHGTAYEFLRNAPLDPEYERRVKADYADFRRQARESRVGFVTERSGDSALAVPAAEREREYEKRWRRGGLGFSAAYTDLLTSQEANDTAAEFFRAKIRAIVRDPAVADLLCPKTYPLGTKRLCVDTEYYATFNRDNVTLVDVKTNPIEAISPRGVRTGGVEYAVDDLVFATGFDAMTGALLDIDIRGRGGRRLADEWAGGPLTYLGLTVAGFPNLFTITGPGSPSVLSNMIVSIEQHVDWIADCVTYLRDRGLAIIEATAEAQEAWVRHVNEVGHMTLYPKAPSWYMGANIPGKPRVFMPYIGGVGVYRQKCDEVAAKGYEGFTLGGVRS